MVWVEGKEGRREREIEGGGGRERWKEGEGERVIISYAQRYDINLCR